MVENTDVANPVKVTYTIKQLAKEAALGELGREGWGEREREREVRIRRGEERERKLNVIIPYIDVVR